MSNLERGKKEYRDLTIDSKKLIRLIEMYEIE